MFIIKVIFGLLLVVLIVFIYVGEEVNLFVNKWLNLLYYFDYNFYCCWEK